MNIPPLKYEMVDQLPPSSTPWYLREVKGVLLLLNEEHPPYVLKGKHILRLTEKAQSNG